jgi:hypothetical protein
MPSDDQLAAAHKAMENVLALSTKGKTLPGGIFESAEMSTTEGILMRDRMIALILPVLLVTVTANMTTAIPGDFNQSEIFRIRRIAGSTFGDLTKGQVIGQNFNGQYPSMDQRHLVGTGNGAKTGSSHEFKLDSATKFGKVMPFKKKSVKLMHDRNIVGQDNGDGTLFGSFTIGGSTITVTGTVNYDSGTVDPVFSAAPATGIEVHIGVDINIEKDPTLIPLVDHEMDSRVLYPHEAAIAGNVTLQALWTLRREFNLNADNMKMLAMRNILAADKDRKVLRDLYFYSKDERSWVMTVPDTLYFQEHYETLRIDLLGIDQVLMDRTEVSGLVGIVADAASSIVFRSLKEPFFTPAPGYRRIPQPHYVGKLFGVWDLYEDPNGIPYESLCYARGRNPGESGYVTGDAIPALSFKHAMMRDLQYKDTLWELGYRDLNPFNGREYFIKLKMVPGPQQ